jgi:hypothetical protein
MPTFSTRVSWRSGSPCDAAGVYVLVVFGLVGGRGGGGGWWVAQRKRRRRTEEEKSVWWIPTFARLVGGDTSPNFPRNTQHATACFSLPSGERWCGVGCSSVWRPVAYFSADLPNCRVFPCSSFGFADSKTSWQAAVARRTWRWCALTLTESTNRTGVLFSRRCIQK